MIVSPFLRFSAMKQNTLDKLSHYLRLSQFELEQVAPDIHIDKVDGKTVRYIIIFKRDAIRSTLKKIKGLTSKNTVSMAIQDLFY